MAMMLYGLPRPVEEVDAIAVMSGLGEHWRVTDAVRAWNNSPDVDHLLIAGANRDEKSFVEPTLENLARPPFNLTRTEGVHAQPHALHTPDQAEWLVGKFQDLDVESAALYVSPYHLFRAYGTVLKSMIKSDVRIPVIPMPVSVSPDTATPETGVMPWEAIDGEVRRISAYQEKGDVATFGELREYISWMWRQPLLQAHDLSR